MPAKGSRVRLAASGLAFFTLFGCSSEAELQGRGVLGGSNAVLALSAIFIVAAAVIVGGLIGLDRFLRSRRELAALEVVDTQADDVVEEPVVAGITVGNGTVPRWLYAAYAILPVFALLYVFNAADFTPKAPAKPKASHAAAGGSTKATITAQNIAFGKPKLLLAADSEVTVEFDNKDSVVHNFSVWEDDSLATKIAGTETFAGPASKSVSFKTPAAGAKLYFNCTVHPGMHGEIEAVAAGSGGSAPAGNPGEVKIAAKDIKFDKSEIGLPAGTEAKIVFHNADTGVPHNVAFYETEAATEPISKGKIITGDATETYTFTTPAAGEYFFHCDVHPAMKGVFKVT